MCSQSSLSNTALTVCLCRLLDELGFDPHQRKELSLFSEAPGLALEPTQPPIQMATGCSFAVGLRGQGVRLTAQLHLETSLRMSGALCLCSPYTPSSHVLTYSMERSPWEANRFSASQEIPRILWNPTVYYRVHKCPYTESHRSSPFSYIPLPEDPF